MKRHHHSTSSSRKEALGQLRIIGGQWRGHKLHFADVEGLRPTGDRVRETLFNWLAPVISGAHCLDLFAGSGALGFEALSRGATHAILVEKDTAATALLKQNSALLRTERAQVIQSDAAQWLNTFTPEKPFDVVFLDPPFATDLLQPCCDLLQRPGLLSKNSLVYIETDRHQSPPITPPTWDLFREKAAGQVCYRLYRCD
ncbi:MAG TPA: 16S rRNA (guanine(966)-N(2))-methyltransferase RsmD [Porticoccus sp.]|nr:16S rRNA (guanine(966)-N(2))-methyltransferase RsmD [Porticoccus sp.]